MKPRDLRPDEAHDLLATGVLLGLNNLLCALIGAVLAQLFL